MRVAFATMSQDQIDAHFGLAPAFAIYDITPDEVRSCGLILCPEQFSEEDKIESRVETLRDCAVVYCTQIGGPAAARLVQRNIHPLKVVEGTPIEGELQRLQAMLKGNPPPWLHKKLIQDLGCKEGPSPCQCCTKD